jgi:hypothetical protein
MKEEEDILQNAFYIADQVREERVKQLDKRGIQNWPSICPLYTERYKERSGPYICSSLDVPSELRAKIVCDQKTKLGTVTWADIALEEFCEAVSATTPELRRGELVQLAAVVESWIDSVDRNEMPKLPVVAGCKTGRFSGKGKEVELDRGPAPRVYAPGEKRNYCFYVGTKFITEVVAVSEEAAWSKASSLHNSNHYICKSPAGKCIASDDLFAYFESLQEKVND